MAIKYFDRGEHPAGFTGWRVVVPAGNKRVYQRYFSARPPRGVDAGTWARRQSLRARLYEASRQARTILRLYRRLVRTDSPATAPAMRVGASGIRLYARRIASAPGGWELGFLVSRGGGTHPWHYPIAEHSLAQAWDTAVNQWASFHEVRDTDREALRSRQPTPEQFKMLRRYMNEVKRADIPTQSLGPVYQEQRAELARKKAARSLGAPQPDLADWFSGLSRAIEQHTTHNRQSREHSNE